MILLSDDERGAVARWVQEHHADLQDAHATYLWPPGTDPAESIRARRELAARVRAGFGPVGLALQILVDIYTWGFGFAPGGRILRDLVAATRHKHATWSPEAGPEPAVRDLLAVGGVGISAASKIATFALDGGLAIYDSRAADGLADLHGQNGRRLVKIPPGRIVVGDRGERDWAREYAVYLAVLRTVLDELRVRRVHQLATVEDIEMALFQRSRNNGGLSRRHGDAHAGHGRDYPLPTIDQETGACTTLGSTRKEFRVIVDSGGYTLVTGQAGTSVRLTDEQVATVLAEFGDGGPFPLGAGKNNRSHDGLGQFVKDRLKKSPVHASHLAALLAAEARMVQVAPPPSRRGVWLIVPPAPTHNT